MSLWVWVRSIGIELAIVTAGICLAVVVARAPIWWWRFSSDGDMARLGEHLPAVGIGSLIGCFFFLWYLRVITRWVGRWPVALAVLTVLIYLATFIPRVV